MPRDSRWTERPRGARRCGQKGQTYFVNDGHGNPGATVRVRAGHAERRRNTALADLLGQNLTVRLQTVDGGRRFFNGHVSRFRYVGIEGDFARHQATPRPWPWFLTRASDCRIFQKKTMSQIIEEIFEGHGFGDYGKAFLSDGRAEARVRAELILECGKAKISLRADGRIMILGGYVLSRSTGVNKIKGGSVQIN